MKSRKAASDVFHFILLILFTLAFFVHSEQWLNRLRLGDVLLGPICTLERSGYPASGSDSRRNSYVSFRNTVPFWCQTDHYTQKRTHNRGALVSTSPLHCFQHSLETLQHPLLLQQNFRSWNKHVVELTFVSQALFILQSPVLQTTATVAHAVLKNAPAGHHDVGMLMLKTNLGYGSIGKGAWLYSALSGANYMSIFTSTTSFSGTLWNVVYFDDDSPSELLDDSCFVKLDARRVSMLAAGLVTPIIIGKSL